MVSPRRAAEKAFELFCTPYDGRSAKKIPPVFHKAEKISFRFNEITVTGFRFRPSHPNHKKVLIVHGFSSNAYKFEKYVTPLLKEGFELVLFDAPAHGASGGKLINAMIYKNVLLAAEKKFGPFYSMIAHSLGGLAASLAFEELPEMEKRKLVLIAPATETTTAVSNFFRMFPLDENTREAFVRLIEEIAEKNISYFSVSRVIKNIEAPVLWIHDKQDTICPYKDVQPLVDWQPSHVQFIVTEQLGHSRIYKDNAIVSAVTRFLAK